MSISTQEWPRVIRVIKAVSRMVRKDYCVWSGQSWMCGLFAGITVEKTMPQNVFISAKVIFCQQVRLVLNSFIFWLQSAFMRGKNHVLLLGHIVPNRNNKKAHTKICIRVGLSADGSRHWQWRLLDQPTNQPGKHDGKPENKEKTRDHQVEGDTNMANFKWVK